MSYQKTGHNISVTLGGETFLCRAVTEASFEAGEPIDITTNATTGLKAYAPADLAEPGEISLTAAFDPAKLQTYKAMLGVPSTCTITYGECPNRSETYTNTYEGAFLKSVSPQEMSTGNMPEVQITIGLPGGSMDGSTATE